MSVHCNTKLHVFTIVVDSQLFNQVYQINALPRAIVIRVTVSAIASSDEGLLS